MIIDEANKIFADETYQLIGAAMNVHCELGNGFLEAVYQEAFEMELAVCGIPFAAQQPLSVFYRGQPLKKTYFADILAYGKIIVELKAIDTITPREEAQLINYLHATQLPLGLLINFGTQKMTWSRKICSKYLRHQILEKSA